MKKYHLKDFQKTFGINEIFQETVLENFAAFSEKLRKHIF